MPQYNSTCLRVCIPKAFGVLARTCQFTDDITENLVGTKARLCVHSELGSHGVWCGSEVESPASGGSSVGRSLCNCICARKIRRRPNEIQLIDRELLATVFNCDREPTRST